jgi:hypothetical protein
VVAGCSRRQADSTGNDPYVRANKVTDEMTKIAAQVPALFEALSGMNLQELMSNVKAIEASRKRRRRLYASLMQPARAVPPLRAPSPASLEVRMPLLERIGTLLRANINDLIAKAEDPEKLARQLVLDMENQLIQIKTQVVMAMATSICC